MERDVINLAGKLKQKYNSANPFIICEQMGLTGIDVSHDTDISCVM